MDYGPQLSRSFKALKVWCALQGFGVRAFVAAVKHILDLARYLEDRLRAEEAWELLAPVTLNAVCFRLRRAGEARNQEVLTRLAEEGTALLGPVRIGDRFGLRACITNYRTQREDIDLILDRLRQLGARA